MKRLHHKDELLRHKQDDITFFQTQVCSKCFIQLHKRLENDFESFNIKK